MGVEVGVRLGVGVGEGDIVDTANEDKNIAQ